MPFSNDANSTSGSCESIRRRIPFRVIVQGRGLRTGATARGEMGQNLQGQMR